MAAFTVTRFVRKFEAVARSMRKPVSLVELSIHDRLIWLELAAPAVRLDGAAGIIAVETGVVTVAVLAAVESPAEL